MAFYCKIGDNDTPVLANLENSFKTDFIAVQYSDNMQILDKDSFTIIFLGRIDNEAYLRLHFTKLESVQTIENLYEGYLHYGDAFLNAIEGDFACVIFDKNTNKTHVFRDHFGTEKLFFAASDHAVHISTEILFLRQNIKTSINEGKIQDYFDFEKNNAPINAATFFNEIEELLPGHIITFDNFQKGNQRQYWKPDLSAYAASTENDLIASFKNALESSVQKRILNRAKLACNLSGGLDSSSVLSLSARSGAKPIAVYFDTQDAQTDEIAFAKNVLEKHEAKLVIVRKDKSTLSLAKEIIAKTGLPDQLFLSGATFISIANELQKSSIDTILTGEGGDAVVGYGFEYLEECMKEKNWVELKTAIAGYVADRDLSIYFEVWNALDSKQKVALYEGYFVGNHIKTLVRKRQIIEVFFFWKNTKKIFAFSMFDFLFGSFKSKVKTGFAKTNTSEVHLLKSKPDQRSADTFEPCQSNLTRSQQKHFSDAFTTLNYAAAQEQIAIYKAYGINCYHPFFDKKVFEVAMAISTQTKFDAGKLRGTLRNAMKGILPEEVRLRTSKVSFASYAHSQCRKLLKEAEAVLGAEHAVWDWVDKPTFEKLKKAFLQTDLQHKSDIKLVFKLNRVIYFALWLDYLTETKVNGL